MWSVGTMRFSSIEEQGHSDWKQRNKNFFTEHKEPNSGTSNSNGMACLPTFPTKVQSFIQLLG